MHPDLKNLRAALQAARILEAFVDWLRSDGDILVSAAELLGGPVWEARAHAVLAAVVEGVPAGDLYDELSAILRLLSLELADDLESEEAALFIAVHPDDPRADDARLCAEALERGLAAIELVAAANVREVA